MRREQRSVIVRSRQDEIARLRRELEAEREAHAKTQKHASLDASAVTSLVQQLAAERAKRCGWSENDEGGWDTGCGKRWEFIDDGPAENGVKFCPYCGGALAWRERGCDEPAR